MSERLETKKYTFTVEGETEQWYLYRLRDLINSCGERKYHVSVDVRVQQSPKKFYKNASAKITPEVFHICDIESNELVHKEKFERILSEMKEAGEYKRIKYRLGYSNYCFELWMVLHKRACNGSLSHRSQYLGSINQAFGEHFENLDQYKHENNFKRCLSSLTIEDVRSAVRRADIITEENKKNGKKLVKYKGYSYYRDNPALSVHEAVRMMLTECGLM